jgi:tetratricopeptide (TPR) repeat protein
MIVTERGGRRGALAVALAACIVNLPALLPGFIHDDHRIIEQNELVRSLARIPDIFTHGYWSVGEASVPNLYRPLTILSFALNHAVHGLHPLGYRLVNLGLHVLVSLLVLALGRRLLAPGPAAAGPGATSLGMDPAVAAALLFAVHPIHTEVLGLVVGRAELLAALATAGSVVAFLKGRDRMQGARARAGRIWLMLSLGCVAAGVLSKENAVAALFLILAADRLVVRGRILWRFHLSSASVLAACLLMRMAAIGGLNPPGFVHYVDNPIAHLPFVAGRLTALKVLGRYALLLVAPVRQSIDYSYRAIPPASSPLEPGVLVGAAVLIAWVAAVTACRKRWPEACFSLAWIGLTMAPVANLIFPIGTILAERLLYLPSVGFVLLAGAGLLRLRASCAAGRGARGAVRAAGIATALLIAAFAARSVARLGDWRDDATIFARALEVAPESVRALFNHGSALEQRGDDAGAVAAYEKAIAIWPAFADAHYNLAGVYARRKNWAEAVEQYREALRGQPGNVPYLVNLGRSLNALGKSREARETLEKAVAIDPKSDRGYTNLGAACLAMGDAAAAVRAYSEALRINPLKADYYRNLGLAQEEAGDEAGSLISYRRGLDAAPGDAELLAATGRALLKSGDAPGAEEALRAAIRARPSHPIYHYQLGRALERRGLIADATEEYRLSIRIAPSSPIPLRALGLLLFRTGDRAAALDALERAAALEPAGAVLDADAKRALAELRRFQRSGGR